VTEATSQVLGRLAVRRLGDVGLFEHAARGDAAAFSEVYRRYQKRVYGFCLARTADPGAAADATQEVFLRLLRSVPGEIESPRAWLFTVARNVAIDSVRKVARLDETGAVDEQSPAWASLAAADTADEVLARSEGRTVFLALRSLSARYRTALILREIHAQSSKDMAEALGSTPGAIDTLVSRARDAFGVAYSRAADLPAPCRSAVELMYRRRGSGITPQQQAGLEAHTAVCERCRSEAKKADDPRHLSALLPFLLPVQPVDGILHRLALMGRPFSDAAAQAGAALGTQPHTWSLASKVAAGLLVATLVAAPVAGTIAVRGTTAKAVASAPYRAGTPSAGGEVWGPRTGNAMGGLPAKGMGLSNMHSPGAGTSRRMAGPKHTGAVMGGPRANRSSGSGPGAPRMDASPSAKDGSGMSGASGPSTGGTGMSGASGGTTGGTGSGSMQR
jgi:RNA polymerase sigma-70 factor (ECF subfamily)